MQQKGNVHPAQRLLNLFLLTIDLDAWLKRSELLVNATTRRSSRLSENQLSTKGPRWRNIPGLCNALANSRVEVLEIAAETLIAKSGPGNELIHAIAVFIPWKRSKLANARMISIQALLPLTIRVFGHEILKWGREGLDCIGVLKEENLCNQY
jgi:hypothetical protein